MNGEMEQLCRIVCCARKALYENADIDYTLGKYVLSTKFDFSRPIGLRRIREAGSVQEWFKICKKRGLRDVKLVTPTATKNRYVLGFANASRGVMVCFWKNGRTTCFVPSWSFDDKEKGWNVIYKEQYAVSFSEEELTYTNQTEEFKSVLLEIAAFAEEIGASNWSGVFRKAYDGMTNPDKEQNQHGLGHLPDDFKGIYLAISIADVFGGMGSWNDSPHGLARAKGLEKEYDELSDRLLKQLRHHLMYITNQCWLKGENAV